MQTARSAIVASNTALNALANSPLKKTTSTSAYNSNYTKVISSPCFVVSVLHNSSGWTFGLRYLYITEPNAIAQTYSSTASAQTINKFTNNAGLDAFANSGSTSSGQLTITYIPC